MAHKYIKEITKLEKQKNWNYCEINGYGYFKNYNRVMVGFCSNTNII